MVKKASVSALHSPVAGSKLRAFAKVGESIVTTLPGEVYGFVTGTSASAAYVSGVAALCASRTPILTGPQLRQILRGLIGCGNRAEIGAFVKI